MKKVIGYTIILIGLALGGYIGGYLLLIKAIMDAARGIDQGTITAMQIGITIVKCLFACPVGSMIGYVGLMCGAVIAQEV